MRLERIGIWFPKIRTKNLPCENLKLVFFLISVFIVTQLNIILGVWFHENNQFYAYLENSINTCRIWIQYESSKWVELWFNFWFVVYFVELIVFCSLLCFLFLFVDYWEYQQRLFSWQKVVCVFFFFYCSPNAVCSLRASSISCIRVIISVILSDSIALVSYRHDVFSVDRRKLINQIRNANDWNVICCYVEKVKSYDSYLEYILRFLCHNNQFNLHISYDLQFSITLYAF